MTMANHEQRRDELYGLLGDLPELDRQVSARTVREEERDEYVLETLRLDLNGVEEVPAYFVRPDGPEQPRPTLLYNHAHGGDYGLGKEELIRGRGGIQDPPYALECARRGWNALCIDTWAFGERRGRTESEIFKEMLWKGRVMWGMMVFDSIKAIDYLSGRPDVDPERIATLGLSMGSTMAWWTAALDPRVAACVDICCMTDFHALIRSRALDGHGIYYYVPRLLKRFTTAQINQLICPRPHLCLAGEYDRLTPPDGLDRIDERLRQTYASAGAPDNWRMVRYPNGHMENADMRRQSLEFLETHM
jgi:dienelactone hydrolase